MSDEAPWDQLNVQSKQPPSLAWKFLVSNQVQINTHPKAFILRFL